METSLGAVTVGRPEQEQRPKLARWLGYVIDAVLYIGVAAIPLAIFPWTLDSMELPKQALLLILTSIGLVAWVGQALCTRTFSIARSWLHGAVAAFGIGYLLVAAFSTNRYISFAGTFGQLQWAVATVMALIVWYALVVHAVQGTTKLYHLILTFLGSSFVVGVIGFFQILFNAQIVKFSLFTWMHLPDASSVMNTVGTINSLGMFMTVPVVLAVSLTVLGCRDRVCVLGRGGKPSIAAMALVWATLLIGVLLALAIDYWPVWATLLIGTAIVVGIPILRTRRIERPVRLVAPAVLACLAIVFLFFRSPLNLHLPAEVAPSALATWSIARRTLQQHPLFGSGPGTWMYDYASYRSLAVNVSQFWNIRFERGLTTFLTLCATIGLVGIALWLLLIVSAVVKSASHLVRERDDDAWQAYLTVFSGWATAACVAFFYNFNVAHHFVFWMLLALLGSLVTRSWLKWDTRKSVVASSLLAGAFIVACVLSVSVIWLTVQRMVADGKYAAAVMSYRASKPIDESIAKLTSAVALNRLDDAYYRNLSQAYLIQASKLLQGPNSDDRGTKINTAITQALTVAKRATEVSPMNVDNWFNDARVLRSIASFTPGADEQAIALYREALKREPGNPTYLDEIGELYILRADAYASRLQSPDEKVRKDAEANITVELGKAAEVLNQALQLKPDYATAHYDLGLVYERQGKLPDAIKRLEQVLSMDDKNVGIAFQLAILYYRNNEKDRSLALFERIVAFDPNYSNARWYLSTLYEERGRFDEALDQVKKVKELNPGNTTVEERIVALTKERDAKKAATGGLPRPVSETITGPSQQNEVQLP